MGGVGSGSKPREYPPEIVAHAVELYESGMTVAEIRAVFPKGYRVQTILQRHIPSRRSRAKRHQAGPANHMWRGDDAGYGAAHLRLSSTQGQAATHKCVDCDGLADDWSYVGGCPDERGGVTGPAYCTHPDHYLPRCRRDHRSYDYRGRRPNGQFVSRREVVPNV